MAALSNDTYGKEPAMAEDAEQPEAITEGQQENAERKPDGRLTAPADGAAVTSPHQPNQPPGNGPAAPQIHPELHEPG